MKQEENEEDKRNEESEETKRTKKRRQMTKGRGDPERVDQSSEYEGVRG